MPLPSDAQDDPIATTIIVIVVMTLRCAKHRADCVALSQSLITKCAPAGATRMECDGLTGVRPGIRRDLAHVGSARTTSMGLL
jgi:hypothetical protein